MSPPLPDGPIPGYFADGMPDPGPGAELRLASSARTWGAAFCAAISEAQGYVSGVGKDKKNTHDNYQYASAEAVIEEARGSLAKAGMAALCVGTRFEQSPGFEDADATYLGRLRCFYLVTHKSGQYMEVERSTPVLLQKVGRPEDKAEATASTYDLSYFLRGLLLLSRVDGTEQVDERDDSARGASSRGPRRQARPEERPEPPEDKPTATELEAQKLIAGATTLELLEQAKSEIGEWVSAGQIVGHGRGRLSTLIRQRRAALETGANPATGELPPDRPSASSAKDADWGDRGASIMRHVADAKGLDALEVAGIELARALNEGMPPALHEPILQAAKVKRDKLELAAAGKAAADAQKGAR